MSYSIVEMFLTLQGEGRWAGRQAVFLRMAGCNMWNGRPEDRHKGQGACALWCDTNFAHGTKTSLADVLGGLDAAWGDRPFGTSEVDSRMVVISGGEPTLQLDQALIEGLQERSWFVAVETNGTNNLPALGLCDHVCVSPKRGSELVIFRAHELKVVLPGGVPGAPPEHQWSHDDLHGLAKAGTWGELFVQPQDVTDQAAVEKTYLHALHFARPGEFPSATVQFHANLKACMDFLEVSPGWRLSYQVHKAINVK